MLVAVKYHVFQTSKAKRPKISSSNGPSIVIHIRIVGSFEPDGQVNLSLFRLPIKDSHDLRADIP